MMDKAIFVCLHPLQAHWRLGALPAVAGDMALFGWAFPGPSIDGGVPTAVAALVAEALTSVARVSFLTSQTARTISNEWIDHEGDQIRALPTQSLVERAKAIFRRIPSSFTLLSTRQRESAAKLFDEWAWPWQLQGQLALLSPRDAAPPDIDRRTLLSLWNGEWNGHATELRAMGILGVLRPGVDGDVFGVRFLSREFRNTVLEAFADHAQRAGYEWLRLSEAEFSDRLQASLSGSTQKG